MNRMEGKILEIYVAQSQGEEMRLIKTAKVIAGRGIEGDRYETRTGAYSHTKRIPDDDRQITIISLQGIQQAEQQLKTDGKEGFANSETRRNIIVDMPLEDLNALSGKRFRIGNIILEGVEICVPCKRPSALTGKEGFLEAFHDRGGIRARILTDGEIQIGDTIEYEI